MVNSSAAGECKTVGKRLRALWSLHVTDGITQEHALSLLDDSEQYIRAWTIQLLTVKTKIYPQLSSSKICGNGQIGEVTRRPTLPG